MQLKHNEITLHNEMWKDVQKNMLVMIECLNNDCYYKLKVTNFVISVFLSEIFVLYKFFRCQLKHKGFDEVYILLKNILVYVYNYLYAF